MTTDVQREAMKVLSEVWSLATDVRLGQLFAHLGFLGEAHLGKGLAYLEDDELIAIMYRHRSELKARLQGDASQPFHLTDISMSVSGSSAVPS